MIPLERTQRIAGDHLNQIASCFVDGSKLTLLVRQPNKPDADFVLTNDDLDEAINALNRRKVQDDVDKT